MSSARWGGSPRYQEDASRRARPRRPRRRSRARIRPKKTGVRMAVTRISRPRAQVRSARRISLDSRTVRVIRTVSSWMIRAASMARIRDRSVFHEKGALGQAGHPHDDEGAQQVNPEGGQGVAVLQQADKHRQGNGQGQGILEGHVEQEGRQRPDIDLGVEQQLI